ncbi:MAG: hypothetical protein AAFO94_15005, partial [Bacteroidota bacterium]
MQLHLKDDGTLTVNGDFTFTYENSGSSEDKDEIVLHHRSKLDVLGKTTLLKTGGRRVSVDVEADSKFYARDSLLLIMDGGTTGFRFSVMDDAYLEVGKLLQLTTNDGGGDMDFNVTGGKAYIDGKMDLSSGQVGQDLDVTVDVTTTADYLEVTGDIVMSAQSQDDLKIDLNNMASLYIGGNFLRPTNFGSLQMENNTQLIYNSDTNQQTIACNDMPGSGTDFFDLKNVQFNNTSGLGMQLEDTLTIDDELSLASGIITTTDLKPIVLKDNASITGGGTTTYIDGPIIKEGRIDGGSSMTLPLGHNSVYAPMSISKITNTVTTSSYKARFRSCPPPFGNQRASSGLEGITENQYWELETGPGSDSVNVELHWSDGPSIGITNTAALVVAMGDEVTNPSNPEWVSIGQGNLTGDINTGSVMNMISCPPPFGNTKFTIGTSDAALSPLPVELTAFDLRQINQNVEISWETATEVNASHFDVERSIDGQNFETIGSVRAAGNSVSTQWYDLTDDDVFAGVYYYRLRQVDLDGMSTTYEIKSIE